MSNTALAPGHPASAAFSTSTNNAFVASVLVRVFSLVSMNFSNAALNSGVAFSLSFIAPNFSIACSRNTFCPNCIPNPCSALSSNNEFAHAGPCKLSLFTVYGDTDAGPPQIEEHPVAFDTYMCSPNN